MKNWDSSDELGIEACPIQADFEDMKEVCNRLKIPSIQVNFVKDYWNDVFEPFIESYKTGVLTPNPDVFCNRFIKFHKFREFALNNLNADFIATGHYARLDFSHQFISSENTPKLLCGKDICKDQSYFLSMTPVSLYLSLFSYET